MTTIRTLTDSDILSLRAQGYIAIIYAAHAYGDAEKGQVISKHKSREALEAAEKRDTTGHWAVQML